MAADTPVKLGPRGIGGSRPNSGRKKGNAAITVLELRKQLKKTLGIPFEQMLAQMQMKLFTDFQNGINVKEAVTFTGSMMKYMIKPIEQSIELTQTPQEMPDQEIELRTAELIARAQLSSKHNETTEQE